ncbi:hypothetical protein F5B20DRAFT_534737 [Whalleya microplaca]|nr:hypothetical protein F5B20DRAFT_534737 [Whalleya microplaca]
MGICHNLHLCMTSYSTLCLNVQNFLVRNCVRPPFLNMGNRHSKYPHEHQPIVAEYRARLQSQLRDAMTPDGMRPLIHDEIKKLDGLSRKDQRRLAALKLDNMVNTATQARGGANITHSSPGAPRRPKLING